MHQWETFSSNLPSFLFGSSLVAFLFPVLSLSLCRRSPGRVRLSESIVAAGLSASSSALSASSSSSSSSLSSSCSREQDEDNDEEEEDDEAESAEEEADSPAATIDSDKRTRPGDRRQRDKDKTGNKKATKDEPNKKDGRFDENVSHWCIGSLRLFSLEICLFGIRLA